MSCTPVPNQALHHEQQPGTQAGSVHHDTAGHQQASDTAMTGTSRGATGAATTTAEEPNAEISDCKQDPGLDTVKHRKAQQGTKRKRSDAEADVIMTDADATSNAGAGNNHAKQQQQQQQHPDGQVTADTSAGLVTGSVHQQSSQQGGIAASDAAQTDTDQQGDNHLREAQHRPGILHLHSLRPDSNEEEHLKADTSWGDKLGRVVRWCWSRVVSEHLCTELQVGSLCVCTAPCQHLQNPGATKVLLSFMLWGEDSVSYDKRPAASGLSELLSL